MLEVSLLLRTELTSIWNCPEMSVLVNVFTFTTPQGYAKDLMQFGSIVICVFAIILVNVLSLCYLYFEQTPKKALLVFIACLFRLSKMIMRPLLEFVIFNAFVNVSSVEVSSKIVSGVCAILFLIVMLVYTRLYFNPLPKDNPFYVLDTNYEHYGCITLFIKIVLLSIYPYTKKLLLMLLILEIIK